MDWFSWNNTFDIPVFVMKYVYGDVSNKSENSTMSMQ